MRLFLSVPFFNDPQLKFLGDVKKLAEEAGFDTYGPLDHDLNEEWYSKRFDDLQKSDRFFIWFDSILNPGEFLYRLTDVSRDQIQVSLPPDVINMIAIGMQASGKAKVRPKKGLILPGDDPRGVEVSNVPNSMTISSEGGLFGKVVGGGAVNIPSPSIMFEFGVATHLGIDVMALSLALPSVGPYNRFVDLFIRDMESLPEAFSDFKESISRECLKSSQEKFDKAHDEKIEKIKKESKDEASV